MIDSLIKDLQNGVDVRSNLIKLRDYMKEDDGKAFSLLNDAAKALIASFLEDEDSKCRRAAGAILSYSHDYKYARLIFDRYLKENVLMIKADYLESIKKLPYELLLPDIHDRIEAVLKESHKEDEYVHVIKEIRMLYTLVFEKEGMHPHEFKGLKDTHEVMLTVKSGLEKELAKSVHGMPKRCVHAGIMVKTHDYDGLFKMRFFENALIYIGEAKSDNASDAGAILCDDIKGLIGEIYKGKGPFFFRSSVDGAISLDEGKDYIKKFSNLLQKTSKNELINLPSDYEIEFLIRFDKEGSVKLYLRPSSYNDNRFDYRVGYVSQSIKPYMAATIVELAKPYLKKDARILDPFCGAGTMLLERRLQVSTDAAYGVDYFADAIKAAKDNSAMIGPDIHYVQRDFKDFTHEYRFDEIITDMPVKSQNTGIEEIRDIYDNLFIKADELLNENGVIIIYGAESNLIKKNLRLHKKTFRLERDFIFNERQDRHLFIIIKNYGVAK